MSIVKSNFRRRFIVAAGLLLLSIIMGIFAHYTLYFPGDLQVTHIVQSVQTPLLVSLMIDLSQAFTGIPAVVMVVVLAVIMWWRLGRLEGLFMAAGGLLAPLNELFKIIVQRPRPTANLVQILLPAIDLGFPSGHAYFATMTLGMVSYFVGRYIANRPLKIVLIIILIALILLVGFSRVYLGDHWTSDVIGGYLFGGGILLLLSGIHRDITNRQTRIHKTME
jgi:membrane-associated phospholipid phosphatase